MAASKPSGQGGGKRSEVDEGNVVVVTLSDLPEEEQHRVKEEMKKELEELEAIRMHERLACYQKTWSGVVQKADTAKASLSKVNSSSLSSEDLAHLVDVSVASKYSVDLAQLTQAFAEDVCITLESFRHNLDDNLPR
jgi:predicted GTPase